MLTETSSSRGLFASNAESDHDELQGTKQSFAHIAKEIDVTASWLLSYLSLTDRIAAAWFWEWISAIASCSAAARVGVDRRLCRGEAGSREILAAFYFANTRTHRCLVEGFGKQ